MNSIYAVQYTYRTDTARQDRFRPAHLDYLRGRIESGELLVSGPRGGSEIPGGLLIYSVKDRDEMQRIVDGDPFVREGVAVTVDIYEWRPLTGPLAGGFTAAAAG